MNSMSAQQILDREFLEIRARILQLAASLDRLDRAEDPIAHDARLQKLMLALQVLLESGPNRAERVQRIFSREYNEDWQHAFQLRS
jgi:hypothetical protein